MATVTKPIALDESLNTTELSSRNVADVLAQELSAVATAIGGITHPDAEDIVYDNSVSGLSATDVQNALDEIVSDIPTVNNGTLTIQQNGTSIGSFSANTASNVTANIKTPTADKKTATDQFNTADGGLLSKCMIDIVPVQSGSGDPYPAGGGKNKLPLVLADIKANNTVGTWSGNVYSCNGSTITVNTDESGNVTSIDVANTPSATVAFNLFYTSGTIPFDTNSTYTLNGCPSGGAGSSNYKLDAIYEKNGSTNILAVDTGNGASANFNALVGATSMTCRIVIYASAPLPKTFYPMLRLSTETDPTFAPYSNVRPISGHTEVDLLRDGKNLCDPTVVPIIGTVSGYYSGTTLPAGSVVARIKGGETYTVSIKNAQTIFTSTCKEYPTVGTAIVDNYSGSSGLSVTSKTITTSADANYLVVNTGSHNYEEVQIELGSTATSYEPYLGHLYQVQIGSTVYGGYVDLVSGVMTIDRAIATANDFTLVSGTSAGGLTWADCNLSNIPSTPSLMLSSHVPHSNSGWTSTTPCFTSGLRVYFEKGTWENYSDIQIAYPLATPTTIQLTPQQIETLAGQNNLSTPLSGQSIETNGVEYKELFTFADVKEYVDKKIPDAPTTDGTYTLQAVVSGGVPTYSWV